MIKIHIGHHFYGAGNAGDDLILAGFLEALKSAFRTAAPTLSCCTPFDRVALGKQFPEIEWLSYNEESRDAAVQACDVWLGLGGTPWQNAVSRWFVDHLEKERSLCAKHDRPMYFLGVGGQDEGAYALPETKRVCDQAIAIWTRDALTAEKLSRAAPASKIHQGADLAHLWLERHPPERTRRRSLVCSLNFDFRRWENLPRVVEALGHLPSTERLWLAQEARPLPGAELELYKSLPEALQRRWTVVKAQGPHPFRPDITWPCGEWFLTARFHSALVSAWAGSKVLALGHNQKLRSVALELGIPCADMNSEPGLFPVLLEASQPVERRCLTREATKAREACGEFFREFGRHTKARRS